MKYSHLSAFEKHLQSASPDHFADVYLILAKDPFVRKKAIETLTAHLLKNEPSPQLALHTFDAEKQSVDLPLQELQSFGFLSKKRVVVVQNADAYEKASTMKLEHYCSSPNRTACLVVEAPSLNRATTFYKKLEKAGIVLDVPEEKAWEKEKSVADWLCSEALKQGKQLSLQTSQMLVKQLGTDQTLLSSELDKLICYTGEGKEIGEREVAAVCSVMNLENGWQLGEAIFRREAAKALRVSKTLLADGTAFIALLRQIRSQFQTQYQIGSLLENGGTPSDVSKEFPYMRGTILEKNIRQAQSYGMNRFRQGLLAIDETELQAKNSALGDDFLAERLMIKLCL